MCWRGYSHLFSWIIISSCPMLYWRCYGFMILFRFHDSSFKLFIHIPFMFRWIQMYNLVLLFIFLWVSAGFTCSALSINAKDVLGCVCFRRKLLFHDCSFVHDSCIFFSVLIVLAEYCYSPLCLFDFRYQLTEACMGMGSSMICKSTYIRLHMLIS